jgi:hypothetical protein
VTRLVERAPAGEIFVVQAVADVALAEIISEVLLVLFDGFFGRERFAVHQLRSHHVRVSPNSRSADVDGVRRHFPAFRAAALDSLRFTHAGRKFSRRFSFPQTRLKPTIGFTELSDKSRCDFRYEGTGLGANNSLFAERKGGPRIYGLA